MREREVHDLIVSDEATRSDILKILQKPSETQFIHEDKYINGITADFTLLNQIKVVGIMECKGSDINVTDYVRGIGQVFQYEYFFEENYSPKGREFNHEFNSILLITSSLTLKKEFNIALFKYPQRLRLLEINEINKVIREITKKELETLKSAPKSGLIAISQYYFRDNRIYEYYLALIYLSFLKNKGYKKVDRKKAEEFLRKLETINNNNWRNAFISLSTLGIIDSNNLPTEKGAVLAWMNYSQFDTEIFFSYFKPYAECIFRVLPTDYKPFEIKGRDIVESIRKDYKGKDVLFLTESDGRYISSFMNILRDDYGCIKFEPRKDLKQIVYNPCKYSKEALILEIENKNGTVKQYLDKYHNLINKYGKQ